jgi:chemosensory pili system protein ChpC
MIPMAHDRILLPNSAVAEIIGNREAESLDNTPGWFAGFISWRGKQVPLISFEVLTDKESNAAVRGSRIVIFNALGGNDYLPFFATVSSGIPHLIQANQSIVTALAENDQHADGVLCPVLVEGVPALIPDLDAMEEMLMENEEIREYIISRQGSR